MGRVESEASTEQAAMNWKSQKLDEIGKNSVWREHLKKEREGRVLNTTFRLNPRTMIALTDKPTQVNPNLPPPKRKAPGEVDETQRALTEALNDMAASPKSKYKEAQTSSQDYGWISDPLVPRSSQFHYGNKNSEVTAYAEAYVESLGVSPFSSKGGKV